VGELAAATLEKSSVVSERTELRLARDVEIDARVQQQIKKSVAALLDRKAEKVLVLSLKGLTAMSDYFVFATATNERQAQALADAVETAMRGEGRRVHAVEGYQSARWILLDYGDVIFHLFHEEARRFYGLERLWGDAADATAAFSG
jgi:ribosome-associated protein